MDYEKKYKEALKRAEKALEVFGTDKCEGARQIFSLFPELKESKDERIRRNIIAALKGEGYYDCDLTNECIAWLEKQGEKPRYSIGDVLCDKSCTTLNKDTQPNFEIIDIKNGMYICDKGSFPISQQDEYELVAKKIDQKSQRMISAEAKEALYDKPTDEEMKELLRTEYEKGRADTIAEMEKDWSEEDEIARKALINLVEIYYGGCIDKTEKKRLLNLLKSLRPQKQWKPSDEQMNTLNLVVSDYYHACTKECDEKAIVLKSILEQLKQRIGG